MKYKDKKQMRGFTLIELIAVLVIMAIIALILTLLVMNIVKKAKDSANKRSVDAYGKAVELAVATHLLDTGDYPTSLDNLTVEYTGNKVVCNIQTLNEDGSVYLSECSVKGTEVKDSSTEDGWYHYGTSSSITYQSYKIGDVVTYNGMNFYVIENSDDKSDRVTLLKETPLSVDEVNTYGIDANGVNHVNRYAGVSIGTAYNNNGYGAVAYYSSETCGCDQSDSNCLYTSCTSNYDESDIKYIVDAWVTDKINPGDLTEDATGYSKRLITFDELVNNLGYYNTTYNSTDYVFDSEFVPTWIYNSQYAYWTMSPVEDDRHAWAISTNGNLNNGNDTGSVCDIYSKTVRPVVTILKSAI